MTPIAELPIQIDSTMISCYRSCPEKFRLEFIYGLRPAALSVDLHAGACFAASIERFYRSIHEEASTTTAAIARANRTFITNWGDFVPRTDTPKTQENVWVALESFFETYPPLTDHIQPYRVEGKPTYEFTFAIPLEPTLDPDVVQANEYDTSGYFPLHPSGSPFVYCGRFDMLGSYHGLPVVRDEKTTKSIGAQWAEQWDLRSQFIGYTWACQQLGIPLDTVVIRGVGILKTKISHAEAIKQYSEHLRNRWLEQLRRDLWRIRRSWDGGYFDLNLADSCSSYGGCVFRNVCLSRDPTNWFSNYKVARWNPLQRNPIEERAA